MPDESKIISWVRSRAKLAHGLVVGIGDDAAAWRPAPGFDLLTCCDLSVEDVHFRTKRARPDQIGHKSLAVTISDIAAMGGNPLYALVSMALPAGKPKNFYSDLIEGMFALAERLDVQIIGGDTSASPGPIFLDTTVIGQCPSGRAIQRSGAQPGDLIFVTGSLGASALGLYFLENEPGLQISPNAGLEAAREEAIQRHLMPEPKVEIGRALGESGVVTSMIDISDGLSTDLNHIAIESECGAVIYADSVPVAEAVILAEQCGAAINAFDLALHGGEEYELLFTARSEHRARLAELVTAAGETLSCIGEVTGEPGMKLSANGLLKPLIPAGYEHEM